MHETIRDRQRRVLRLGITLCVPAVLCVATILCLAFTGFTENTVLVALFGVEIPAVGPIGFALIVVGVWGPINKRTICDLAELLGASERQSIERANHARRIVVLVAGVLALVLSVGGFVFFMASPVPKHLALGLVGFIGAGPVGFVRLLIGLFR